tara:strand:- start:5 stop:196 length:192 start_codon:yes stop_codon:yes gene_type:complete
MCMGNFDEVVVYFVGFTFAFFGMLLFYALIIHPRDEAGFAIMQCMGADRSYESYEACVDQLNP